MTYPSWEEIRQGSITNTYSHMAPWYFPMIGPEEPTFMGRPMPKLCR